MSTAGEVFAACISMVTTEIRVRGLDYVFGWSLSNCDGPQSVTILRSNGFHKFRLVLDPAAGTLELKPPIEHELHVPHVSVSLSDPDFVKTIVDGMVRCQV